MGGMGRTKKKEGGLRGTARLRRTMSCLPVSRRSCVVDMDGELGTRG